MEFKTTFPTPERGTVTVPLVDVTAFRALLRGVPGVYEKRMLPKSFRFVPDKLFQLVKRPIVELVVELLTSSLLDSDLAQVFKSKYRIIRVHDLFRYTVVHVSHKPSFLTGETLELAFCRLGAFRLQLFPKMSIPSSGIFNLLRVVKRVIGTDCNIHDTSIDPNHLELGYRFKIIMFKGHVQIERVGSSIIGYRGRFDLPSEIVSVVLGYKESCLDSTLDGCNRSYAVNEVHCNNSLVVPHRSERSSLWKRSALARFQSFTRAISCTLYQRRRKIRNALTDKLVGGMMVIDFVPRLVLKSPFSGFGKSLGISSHRFSESNSVSVAHPKLECNRSKHVHISGG